MLLNFPRGRSGIGLLIFRVTAAGAIIAFESNQLTGGPIGILSFASIVLAILIALGLFTSLSSAIVAFLLVVSFFFSRVEPAISTTIVALSVSLSMMGAGAYSIDGLFHGRRRIIVPKQ
jgi:uncharacterized membrane protein YphA (DoxX/SURF4 family)